MSIELPLPRTSVWRSIALVIAFIPLTLLVVWASHRYQLGWLSGLLFVFPAILIVRRWYKHPCPKCGSLMTLRKDYLDANRFRCMLDCPHCGITWDTGDIGDDSVGPAP